MKILLTILLLSVAVYASLVNAVAIVVDQKPITLLEIDSVMQQQGVSENEAAEILVQRALYEIEAQKYGIEVSDYEVEAELERVAQRNGMDLDQLIEMIQNSGQSYSAYRENFAQQIQSKKLFDNIASSQLSQPSQQALKVHYQNNIDKFTTFKTAQVIQYVATNKAQLQQYISDPFSSSEGVERNKQTVSSDELSGNLLYMIENTSVRKFTPIIPVGQQFVALYIQDKEGKIVKEFQSVQNQVLQSWRESQREQVIKQHFQKVRAQTDIEIIR
ncbi:MAG: hypothetical protein ACQESH_01270 [Campylobacterota bacterium]